MKIVFFGDSITDMSHHNDQEIFSYGSGFLMYVAGELYREDPKKYRVINKGIGGNRVADLYSRVKTDVWYEQPDVVSILIGVNDVWQEVDIQNEKKLGTKAELARRYLAHQLKKLEVILFGMGQSEGARQTAAEYRALAEQIREVLAQC